MNEEAIHILVVEDEVAHTELIRRAFEVAESPARLEVARSLRAAQAYLAKYEPGLVIVDLLLPDGKGTDLLPANKEILPYPVVVMTSYGDEHVAVEAIKAGALDYVVKSEAALAAMPRIIKRVLREWGHIVERRQAELALRKSQALLARTERIGHMGSWEYDLINDEVFWSDEVYRIYGLKPGEIKPNFEVAMGYVHPEDRPEAIDAAKRALETGQSYHREKRIIRVDGTERVVTTHSEAIFNDQHEIIGLTGFMQDITDRKQAEQALSQSERLYRSLFDNALDAIFILDEAGNFVEVNPATCILFGYNRQTLQKMSIFDIIRGDEANRYQARWQQFIQTGQASGELSFCHSDGHSVMTEYRAVANYMPGHHLAMMCDVSERKLAEVALNVRLRQQAAVAKLGQQALAEVDLAVLMNEATQAVVETLEVEYCKVLELLPDEQQLFLKAGTGWRDGLVGEAILDNKPDSQAGYTLLASEPVIVEDLRTETRFSGPAILHEHGVISGLGVIIAGQKNRPFGILGAHSTERHTFTEDDIHFLQAVAHVLASAIEHQQAEAEIRQRNRGLGLLNRVTAASAASLEPEAMLEIVCRELSLAFQVPQAAAALLNEDRTTATVVAEYLKEDRLSVMDRTIPVKGVPSFEVLLELKEPLAIPDVRNEPRLASVQPLLAQLGSASLLIVPFTIAGKLTGGVGLLSDEPRNFSAEEIQLAKSVADQVVGAVVRARLEAEQRRLEAEYQQAQKMEAIGQLAAGIAHDFNNLLTAINGFAELLQMSLARNDPNQDAVRKILYSGQRAAELVSQLLAFSRKQIIQPKVINLNKHVRNMEKMLRRIIGENIKLKTRLTLNLWPIKVDPTQIEQVIINLAINARDAMPDGGQLTIDTSQVVLTKQDIAAHPETQPGDYVLMTISDDGPGMTEEVKAHIFEPFFTTKEVGKGTGLGLATVFGIIKQSKGDIQVESSPGVGTTFKIYLPRTYETNLPELYTGDKRDLLSGHETILLVEDDAEVRGLIQRVLERQDYSLLKAEDGQEALRLAAQHTGPIHLLLTDVVMPGMSGQVLAQQVVERHPSVKVLYISGYNDEAIVHHGVLEPGVALLQKPFSPTLLARTIRRVLDEG